LPPRTLAGRRRDQLTKAPDYGAVLVAITVAQFYLSGMLQRTLPAGFIAPCLPTKTTQLPSGGQWLHEIKHDGFPIIARKGDGRVRLSISFVTTVLTAACFYTPSTLLS
jgi:ATP-dependent DNA ligase